MRLTVNSDMTPPEGDEDRIARLQVLAQVLEKKRKAAILGRQALGIDKQWEEDIEFYEGIDDANRAEMTGRGSAWHTKPPGQADTRDGEVRSTVFVNITRPYCDAAAARMADMLMPTDDRAFAIEPTPVPDLMQLATGRPSLKLKQKLLALYQGPQQIEDALARMQAEAVIQIEDAKERARNAQKRIDDWHIEGQYHAEVRKVIDDAAKTGTGILKGPYPVKRTSHAVNDLNGVIELVVKETIAPCSKRIDMLNFFPDPACGENIQNGSYVFERDFLSERRLEELKEQPHYLADMIELALKEGPKSAHTDAPPPQGVDPVDLERKPFEVWYYYGMLDRDDLEAMGCECPEGVNLAKFNAVVTMVNGYIIKAALNPMDTGGFPFDVMVWQRQSGKWTGIGVARQIRVAQRIVNAAARAMMDNAGLLVGPQIVVRLNAVEPADGVMALGARKVWYVLPGVELGNINQVFGTVNIESHQAELMAIIQFGLKIAEDVTGLPLLLQGQLGKAPDTVGGMQMLTNNSSTVLRRLAKLFDDCITEPHIRRYYLWIMQYGEEHEKGDFQINARGSSALVERDLQNQAVVQMGAIVKDPAFRVDPAKWFTEYCKSQRLDPKMFQYDEEEWAKIEQQAQGQPQDPRIAVAQIMAQHKERLAQLEAQFERQMKQIEQQHEATQNERDRMLELLLARMEQVGQRTITVDELKAMLAGKAMQLRTQRDLATMRTVPAPQVATPPSEPPGRAPRGQAYQR